MVTRLVVRRIYVLFSFSGMHGWAVMDIPNLQSLAKRDHRPHWAQHSPGFCIGAPMGYV